MKPFSLRALAIALGAAARLAWGTDEIFINTGNLTYNPGEAPQIDAKAFFNSGTFSVYTFPLPYDFQSVLSYTNRGAMVGSLGFQFDLASSTSKRVPSANFVNARGGSIHAIEGYGLYASNTLYYPTLVLISATNIVNEGTIAVENSGILRLEGKYVNLTRGGLQVGSIQTGGAGGWPVYINEPGISDYYWGTGSEPTNNIPGQDSSRIVLSSGNQWQAVSPSHFVANNNAAGFVRVATSVGAAATGYTNIVGNPLALTLTNANGTTTNILVPTNIVRQAVFVGVSDTNNFGVRTRFFPSTRGQPFNTIAVEVRMANTNVVTATGETNALYVLDRLGAETNIDFGTNVGVTPLPTLRPAAYEVWRSAPVEYAYGFNGNAAIDKSFVYSQSFSNRFVTNLYAGYAAYVDYLTVRAPVVAGVGPLDQPGRIEVVGDQVDLTKARFRGQYVVSVDAKHLISSSNTVVDAPDLLFNLGSTNGLLTVQNLSQAASMRMSGFLQMWSGLWTNQMAMVFSNWYIDATTNYFSPITNPVDVGIHVFILSADGLSATQQVVVHDFVARSTNIIVNDPITVDHRLLLLGESFTLNGKISLTNMPASTPGGSGVSPTNGLLDWRGSNFPAIAYFTNNGVLSVPNIAYLGGDREVPLKTLINHGTLNAFGHSIRAEYYEDTGFINTSNTITIVADSAKLEGGKDLARGGYVIQAGDLKLRNHSITADGGVVLAVSASLTDAGAASPNTITVKDGFRLLNKPATGDLLGTTFASSAAQFYSPLHIWMAEDRGADRSGFANNAAIGRLSLDVSPGGELRFSGPVDQFEQPLPGQYALYVDYLQMQTSVSTDPEAVIWIDPGLTIYFANANVPAEQLDGKFNGHLRWVKNYAGAASGTPVASRQSGYEVKSINVNAALLSSQTLDSDADGLANAYDNWPFDGVTLKDVQVVSESPLTVRFAWDAAGQTVYRVESTPTLQPAKWTTLTTLTNAGTEIVTLSITNATSSGQEFERFYRVRYDP